MCSLVALARVLGGGDLVRLQMLSISIYISCHYSSSQLRLPAGSVLVWTKSRARYIHTSIDIVDTVYTYCNYFIYINMYNIYICISIVAIWYIYLCLIYTYVLPLFVYSTLLVCWKYDCVDKVAYSIYVYVYRCCLYVSMYISAAVSGKHVYMSFYYLSTQLRLSGSVMVWTKSRVRYIYICQLISSCRYVYWRWCVTVWNLYMYCHYLSVKLHLPTGIVIVWTKLRVRYIYIHLWILSLPYWQTKGKINNDLQLPNLLGGHTAQPTNIVDWFYLLAGPPS